MKIKVRITIVACETIEMDDDLVEQWKNGRLSDSSFGEECLFSFPSGWSHETVDLDGGDVMDENGNTFYQETSE